MSRRGRSKKTPQSQPSKPPVSPSNDSSSRDPSEFPVLELLKRASAKFWYTIIAGLIVIAGLIFYAGAQSGQTDFVMDLLGNDKRSKLEAERVDHGNTKRTLASTQASLDKAQTEITKLRQELDETREKHEILEQFGSDFWLYRSYDLKNEIGTSISLGNCGRLPCYTLVLVNIDKEKENITFNLSGIGTTNIGVPPSVVFPLKKGCGADICSGRYRFRLVMEDDRITSLRASLGIKTTNKEEFRKGLKFEKVGCDLFNVRQDR